MLLLYLFIYFWGEGDLTDCQWFVVVVAVFVLLWYLGGEGNLTDCQWLVVVVLSLKVSVK